MAVLRTEVFLYERAVILISCFLSFLGSCLIIFTYMLWADLRTKPRKLLVFLSVADLLSAVSYFYGVLRDFDSDSWDCVLQGSVSTFANTSSFFWTVAVAIYLYIFIHAALSEYRPILAASPMSQSQSSMADTKLTLIPVIFIALRIWSTIRFILTLAESPAVQNPMLVILHGVGNTFQGGANCIMFVLCTQVVRLRLASVLCCCRYAAGCTCCRGSDSNQQPVETPRTEELPVCLG
ncbi:UNVERIFIED_CONTAM: hypothetical protein FKN15_000200 [Acipenser sinensis]